MLGNKRAYFLVWFIYGSHSFASLKTLSILRMGPTFANVSHDEDTNLFSAKIFQNFVKIKKIGPRGGADRVPPPSKPTKEDDYSHR